MVTHMFNEVTDDAIIKVVHLCPWYTLAKGDINCRSSSKSSFQRLYQTQPSFYLSYKGPSEKPIFERDPLFDSIYIHTHPRLVVNLWGR
jgi:hypothetical protein